MGWWRELGWIDLTLLGVLSLSVVVGLWRGITFELLSLLGWVVAWFIANALAPLVAGLWPAGGDAAAAASSSTASTASTASGPGWHLWVSWAAIFVVVLLVMAVLARLMRALVHATPLSPVDHVLGALVGAVRAAVILVAVATAIALSPFAAAPAWKASHGQLWLGEALEAVKPLLPSSLSSRLAT